MPRLTALAVTGCLLAFGAAGAAAAPGNGARDAILAGFAAEARAADPGFAGFAAARGEALFRARQSGGRAETPSCTTCHTEDPTRPGQTRAGKEIEPMAVSKTPDRFTDPEKVAKWLGRNCNSVLGRPCTATEKGDVLTFLSGR
ncbi:MAG: DUF1924 domain-containing protein [Rhodospirillaceae bacterium]